METPKNELQFFDLTDSAQKELIQAASSQLDMSEAVIEKDFWVCWLLEKLFLLPENMVFKGGTSLSKAFQLIDRFSEDVDITLDYRNFHDEIDFKAINRSQLKKLSEQLKTQLKIYIEKTVIPYFMQLLPSHRFNLTLSEDGEQLRFYYPSAVNSTPNYLRDHVLIEFGMRNSTEPYEQRTITPYLNSIEHTITLPSPIIRTLSPVRTFWEKATLIHVECHRGRLVQSPERLSRHWYDLYKLYHSHVGKNALKNLEVLESVIVFKKAFFNASYANYDACFDGALRLIPDAEDLKNLKADFNKMIIAGMFYKKPPAFDGIIDSLLELEQAINQCTETIEI